MADVGGIRITDDVICPFVASGIGVASADEFLLQMLELLKGSKLVGHE